MDFDLKKRQEEINQTYGASTIMGDFEFEISSSFNMEAITSMQLEVKHNHKPLIEIRKDLTELVDKIYLRPEQDEYRHYMGIERQLPPEIFKAVKSFFIPDEEYALEVFGEFLPYAEYGLLSNLGHPIYNGRFVYPVLGFNGEVLGLIGYDKFAQIKYLLSRSRGFEKNRMFYGMQQMQWIYQKGYVVVIEGIVDPLLFWLLDIPAIGLNGNILSPFVARILNRFGYNVLFMPDSNEAGEASVKYWKKLVPTGSVLKVTGANDPDDWRKKNDINILKAAIEEIRGNMEIGMPVELTI